MATSNQVLYSLMRHLEDKLPVTFSNGNSDFEVIVDKRKERNKYPFRIDVNDSDSQKYKDDSRVEIRQSMVFAPSTIDTVGINSSERIPLIIRAIVFRDMGQKFIREFDYIEQALRSQEYIPLYLNYDDSKCGRLKISNIICQPSPIENRNDSKNSKHSLIMQYRVEVINVRAKEDI